MGLNAAVQALKKAEPLKDKVQSCKDLLNDNDAWVCQQQLQKIYQQVLILDLEYALDRKVEQELWNLGFKNYIATLQTQAKDRKNPKRGESLALLGWCLEAASGFYLTLLQEICTAFDLDLPFRRKGYIYGCTSPWKAIEKLSVPHKSSCFYACQYCLVHLGDIARYRNESKQAELFYRHAVSLSPSSGQPYNQLALLEASRGNKLGTVFHYARSVAVKHPFPVATTNLAKTLSSALNDSSFNIEGKTKLNSQEYIAVFLKLHGTIHNLGDVKAASVYAKLLTETLTALIATESFSSWMLVQMLVINLYALEYTAGVAMDSTETLKNVQLSYDEKLARDCILDLIAGSLSALLLPVYTIKNSIVEYFALPSIKLCLDWIRTKPTVLEEAAFTSRLQIWPSLCVLLNALQNCVLDFAHDQYTKVPLPEDRDLQGFLPLEKSFESLKFTNSDLEGDVDASNKLRAVRILRLGHCLAQYRVNGSAPIAITAGEKEGDNKFSSMSEDAGLSNELIKELEELSLNKEKRPAASISPVLSESASSKGSADIDILENTLEKRMGILKPQGSLERNRDSTVVSSAECNNVETISLPTARKPRQNIAMQAIMRRAETEQKQVTFKNVSPVIVEEENEKRAKPSVTCSPTTMSIGHKGTAPVASGEMTKSVAASNTTLPLNIRNRPPLMPFATSAVQTQNVPGQNQAKSTKMQHNMLQSSQINQLPPKEQQVSGMLPSGVSTVPQGLGAVCYQNQPFNVQNPHFTKNFMSNHAGSIPNYQVQAQLTNPSQALAQPMVLQHALAQNRPLHQRVPHNVAQNSLVHQNIDLSTSGQHSLLSAVSQNMNSHQPPNVGLQPGMNVQQQQQAHSLNAQQQNLGKGGNLRPSTVVSHNQVSLTGPVVANISALAALNTYRTNLRQTASMLPNAALSPSQPNLSNFPLNINQPNFTQSGFVQMSQKQSSIASSTSSTVSSSTSSSSSSSSSSVYGKNAEHLEFPFNSQGGMPKSQLQSGNNYPHFHNYENADFNLWKNNQQPQLPVACWGTSNATTQLQKDTASVMDNYRCWEDPNNSANAFGGRLSVTPCNAYRPDLQHSRHFGGNSNFEDSRKLDVDFKSTQPINPGNAYSLFSGNSWGSSLQTCTSSSQDQAKTRLNQQSLWSGPGPSPLERLLEQQKSLREGGT